MNRGIRREPVFLDDWCCEEFLCSLEDAVARFEIVIHGYALMPNHFHLMVESVHGNLSAAMAHVSSTFSARMNRRHGWEGSVFRGRFHNRVVTDEAHWLYLLAYLHLNPLRARLVMTLAQSRWTSHLIYTGVLKRPEWLEMETMMSHVGGPSGYAKFMKSVQIGKRPKPEGFGNVLFEGRRSSEYALTKQPETSRKTTEEEALRQVIAVTGVSRDELTRTRRGTVGNPARAVAAWWLTHGAGLSNVIAGEVLKMTPPAVSRSITRVQGQLVKNGTGKIGQWILAIKEFDKKEQ